MSEQLPRPSALLVPERVLLDLNLHSKKRVFEEAGLAFENSGGPLRSKVLRHLLERERLGSTLIDKEVAVPHARIDDLNKPLATFVRMAEPFPFDAPDAQARLLFVLLVPDRADASHLEILSLMSRMLTDPEMASSIDKAQDGESLIAEMQAWELRHFSSKPEIAVGKS